MAFSAEEIRAIQQKKRRGQTSPITSRPEKEKETPYTNTGGSESSVAVLEVPRGEIIAEKRQVMGKKRQGRLSWLKLLGGCFAGLILVIAFYKIAEWREESNLRAIGRDAVQAVRDRMKDPESAKFRNVSSRRYDDVETDEDGVVVCGEVNAKNGFGGYIGFKPFVYTAQADTTMLQPLRETGLLADVTFSSDHEKLFTALWDKFCL